MIHDYLSISNFQKYALYQDQVELVKSICLTTTSYSNYFPPKFSHPHRFIFWGDYVPYSLLKSATKNIAPLISITTDPKNEADWLSTLSQYPLNITWIFANKLPENILMSTPVDHLIFFVYLRSLKNDYTSLEPIDDWISTAQDISGFSQSWHTGSPADCFVQGYVDKCA